MDLFDLAVRRRCRGVELNYKIVKKAAPTEQASHGQVGRESCHGLKGISEHENPNLVKIEQTPRSAGNTLQVILYPILEASNAQRMAYSRMKNARIGARINPAGDRFCWRRMPITESNVQNGSPSRGFVRKRWAAWKNLAGKSQRNSTKVDQLGGTFIITGSDSPFSSALVTTSSYELPYARTRCSSAEKATQPPGGAA